jgi:hypothetical protein
MGMGSETGTTKGQGMATEVVGTAPTTQADWEKAYPWAVRVMRFDDDGLYPEAREAAEKVTPLFETEPETEIYPGSWWPPRSEWGPGPWMVEPDLVEWRAAGIPYPLLIVRGDLGALCGYVGVPPGHPCYGPESTIGPNSEDITASGPGGELHVATAGPSDLWWLGFDCISLPYEFAPKMAAGLRLTTELTGIPLPANMRQTGRYVELDECRKRTEALALELLEIASNARGGPT